MASDIRDIHVYAPLHRSLIVDSVNRPRSGIFINMFSQFSRSAYRCCCRLGLTLHDIHKLNGALLNPYVEVDTEAERVSDDKSWNLFLPVITGFQLKVF
jgi:hypothetical protein